MSSLRINNITFDVPPQHIEIIKQDYNTSIPSLRAASGSKIKSGKRTITIAVDLTFATGFIGKQSVTATNWINQQLVPLLIYTRKCPFVSIENEKIRNEVFGNDLSKGAPEAKINMAAIIKGISGTTSAKNPELLTVKLILQVFNYSPFSKDFSFKQVQGDRALPSPVPTKLFDEYIQSGTYEAGSYINSIPLTGNNDLEFYFKEYKRLASDLEPDYKTGWSSYITDGDTQVVYRYIKFTIPATGLISSGSLVTEGVSFSVETKTPSISLLNHSIPTSQFLGGTEASINFNLFAAAELESQTPIGSSKRLGQLNRLLEVANNNALTYSRIVNTDIVFIKHPLAKLLRYQQYNEPSTVAYNYDTNRIEPFNPNQCFATVLESSSSETVDGLPYCSRFSLTLTEGYKYDWNTVGTDKKLSGDPAYATTQLMSGLINKFGIKLGPNDKFIIGNRGDSYLRGQPDWGIAYQFVDAINASRERFKYNTALEYVINLERDTADFKNQQANNVTFITDALATGIRSSNWLNISLVNSLAMDIVKLAFDPIEQKSIMPEYSIGVKEILAMNKIIGEDAYPDLLLPKIADTEEIKNPDFFFYNEEDELVEQTFKDELAKKVLTLFPEITSQYNDMAANKSAAEEFNERLKQERGVKSTDFFPTNGPPAPALNIPLLEETKFSEGTKTAIQNVLNIKAQEATLKGAIQEFDGMTYQMRRSMPTFRLYLKEGNIDSLNDISADRLTKKNPWYSFVDFYDLNSILDIRLVKHRDNPADMLIIRMTNTKDDLVNKTFPGKVIEKKDPSMNDRNFKISKDGKVSEQLNGLKKRRQAELALFNKKTTAKAGKVNQEAINLIKSYEKLRLTAYDDGVGNWTIGYGHTDGVKSGDKIDESKANNYLDQDIANAQKIVDRMIQTNGIKSLTENEYSALVVAAFNIGPKLITSSIAKKLAIGNKDITKEMLAYTWAKVADSDKAERIKSQLAGRAGDSGQTTNILSDVVLSEGTRVELRLGYDVDPNKLKVEFSGRITQVGGGDILEIVCQGDGIELIQELKGVGTDRDSGNDTSGSNATFTFRSNAHEIVREVLVNSPEVLSLGTKNAQTVIGALESHLPWEDRGGGKSILENIFLPSLFTTWDNFADTAIKYSSLGITVGGLFGNAPGAALGTIVGGGIGLAAGVYNAAATFFGGSPYIIYEQTLWDILQEQALRFPGIICSVVPFDRRSTIFMGYPDQLYFHRGMNVAEALAKQNPNNKNPNTTFFGGTQLTNNTKMVQALGGLRTFDANTIQGMTLDKDTQGLLQMMKSFRNYHLVTSEHDIVDNDILVNSDDVYNVIEVMYPETKGSTDNNFDGSVGFSKYETTKIAADDDLNKDYIKKQTLIFHNANNSIVKDLPERYAISSLCRSLNNVYKGKLTILGRPGIKPYDIVYVCDTYNQIAGPVEVQGVIQTLSFDTGWLTEIIPSMITLPANSSGYAQIKAMQTVALAYQTKNIKKFYSEDIIQTNMIGPTDPTDISRKPNAAITGGSLGAGIGVSAMVAANNVKSFLPDLSLVLKEGSGVLAKAGGGIGLVAGRVFSSFVPLLGFLATDYAAGAIVNWMRHRQPIVILPLTRNGRPWYSGLYGMKNNDTWGAVKDMGDNFTGKLEYYYDNIIGT